MKIRDSPPHNDSLALESHLESPLAPRKLQVPMEGEQCTSNEYLQRLSQKQPLVCACAWIGSRRLSWLPWLGSVSRSDGGLLNYLNKELAHQHIRFDDTGDNIGFGPRGIFQENMEHYRYVYERTCYNAERLRHAAAQVGTKGVGLYGFLGNNCQRFVERVKHAYEYGVPW